MRQKGEGRDQRSTALGASHNNRNTIITPESSRDAGRAARRGAEAGSRPRHDAGLELRNKHANEHRGAGRQTDITPLIKEARPRLTSTPRPAPRTQHPARRTPHPAPRTPRPASRTTRPVPRAPYECERSRKAARSSEAIAVDTC